MGGDVVWGFVIYIQGLEDVWGGEHREKKRGREGGRRGGLPVCLSIGNKKRWTLMTVTMTVMVTMVTMVIPDLMRKLISS